MDNLLARFAENGFWIARYLERVENLARILDVNETFSRKNDGEQDWLPVVELYADNERYFENYREASAASVIRFYVIDRDNPGSIISILRKARENAREIRHLISTEMWMQINIFYNRISALSPRQLTSSKLSSLCLTIKLDCQRHTGIVEGTLYHDQLWHFYELGQYIERADMGTRLLDIKYHRLLPSTEEVGSAIDIAEWNALLRSVAGYHAYRRIHPTEMELQNIAGFLLFDKNFPRSVAACIELIQYHINSLRNYPGLRHTEMPMKTLAALYGTCQTYDILTVIDDGMHEFLDRFQALLVGLSDDLGQTYFGHQ